MKAKSVFSVYIVLGMMGVIATQALPVVYSSYGLDSNQIYNLISIVFLATVFQPILGYIIDRFFSQERGIEILLGCSALIALVLVSVTTYPLILGVILVFSIFKAPLFAVVDGYAAGLSHRNGLNMGLMRAGSTIGFGIGMTILMLFLNVFNLSANYSFLFLAIILIGAVLIVECSNKYDDEEEQETVETNPSLRIKTDWSLVIPLALIQVFFFGFAILKINYTTPFLVEYGYSNNFIASTALFAMIPLLILMPLFGKIYSKFKYTTILYAAVFITIIQMLLFILFPTSLIAIIVGSFLNGFIFPLYTPVFGLFLRKVLDSRYVSTGFTTIFTMQNIFIFILNQFVVISILNKVDTTRAALFICLCFFILSLVPLTILRAKKY